MLGILLGVLLIGLFTVYLVCAAFYYYEKHKCNSSGIKISFSDFLAFVKLSGNEIKKVEYGSGYCSNIGYGFENRKEKIVLSKYGLFDSLNYYNALDESTEIIMKSYFSFIPYFAFMIVLILKIKIIKWKCNKEKQKEGKKALTWINKD